MTARIVLALSTLLLALSTLAGSLVVKDDFRSPRNKERSFRKSTRLIVLHTTEAHARSALNKLSERGEAHYCVTDRGEVYRIVDRDREAFHAGRSMWNGKEDCDEYSIGIEVVGYHDKAMPLRQLAALKELLDRLKKMYNLKDAQVVCHSQVAYGAPNTWFKQKHRGRKRCGMLFAMSSVRSQLGLTSRVAYDPDVRAKRLIQADPYLNSVLYGRVDTMVSSYGRIKPQASASPALVAAKPPAKPVLVAAKPPAKSTVPAKPAVATKPKVAAKPPPVERPKLIVPPAVAKDDAKPEEEEKSRDWLKIIGLKGGYFKKDAKLVVPENTTPPPEKPSDAAGKPLPLPPNLQIGKMGDGVKNLSALAKLPGYVRGGPVTAELSPFKIAGAAWKAPSTYYYNPQGKIIRGDQVDEKSIEVGTFVFYRKP